MLAWSRNILQLVCGSMLTSAGLSKILASTQAVSEEFAWSVFKTLLDDVPPFLTVSEDIPDFHEQKTVLGFLLVTEMQRTI